MRLDERRLGAVAGPRRQPSGLRHCLVRLAQQPTAGEVRAELGQVTGLACRSAFHLAVRDCLAHHGDCFDLVVGQVAGTRAALEELCASARGKGSPALPEGASVLRGCLPVRAGRRGVSSRGRGELEHGIDIVRRFGVVRKPRRVDETVRSVPGRREYASLQCDPARRRHRVLDGRTGELVTKGHGVSVAHDESRCDALVQVRDAFAGNCLEQPGLRTGQSERDGLEHLERLFRESSRACEDGVTHRRRNPGSSRCEHLRDEERVPARQRVQVGRVDRTTNRKLGDGIG